MKLSILIVTFNCADVLPACLDSLKQRPPSVEHEIIVSDNGSTDGTLEVLLDRQPSVRQLETGGNLGYAAGVRTAAAEATGELLLVLNPDTEVLEGSIDTMIRALERDPSIWVVGACLVAPDGGPNTSWGDFPSAGWAFTEMAPWRRLGLPLRSRRQVGRTCDGVTTQRDVDWVSGAALMTRRTAWDAVGGFDPDYFLTFEETDYCYRVRRSGGRVVLEPDARIVHHEGATIGRASVRAQVWFSDGLFTFLRKHHGRGVELAARAWLLLVNSLLWCASWPLGVLSKETRGQRPRYGALVRTAVTGKARLVDGSGR